MASSGAPRSSQPPISAASGKPGMSLNCSPRCPPGRRSAARVAPSNHAPHPLVSCHLYDAGEIARCRVLTLGETSRVQPCYDALRPPPPDGRSPASRSAGAPVRDAGRGLLSSSSPTRRPPTARYRRNSAASARNGAVTKTTTASSMRRMIPMACLYPLAERSGGAGSPQPTLVWRTAGGSGYSPSALPPNKEGGGVDAVTSLASPLGLTLAIPGIIVLIIVVVLPCGSSSEVDRARRRANAGSPGRDRGFQRIRCDQGGRARIVPQTVRDVTMPCPIASLASA
jgi:hypothetical protein